MAKEKIIEEPTIFDSIKDENDQRQAVSDFRSLMRHNGWRRIEKYYQDVMNFHQSQLNGDINEEEIKTINDLKLIRFKRDSAERMINLPDILAELAEAESEDIELDPHFKPDDFDDTIK